MLSGKHGLKFLEALFTILPNYAGRAYKLLGPLDLYIGNICRFRRASLFD